MARRVEGHHAEAAGQQRRNESGELPTDARPAVHEVDGGPVTPGPAHHALAGDAHLETARAAEEGGDTGGPATSTGGEEEIEREGGGEPRGHAPQDRERRPERPLHRHRATVLPRRAWNDRAFIGRIFRDARVVEQPRERAAGALDGAPGAEQPQRVVAGQHDAVQLVRELLRVHVPAEVSFRDPGADGVGDHVQPVLLGLHEALAHRPGWSSSSVESATNMHPDRPLDRGHSSQCSNSARTRFSPRGAASAGLDHPVHEALDAELEHLQLQRFLGLEVGEEAALRQLELVGEHADGEGAEADPARHGGGALEDGLAGQLAFSDGRAGHGRAGK